MNRGFIEESPQENDYEFLGSQTLSGEVLAENGDWRLYLPPLELQYNNHFDTWSCVTYSFLNCIEALAKRKYGEDWNKSDRFTSVMSGTVPGRGNSLRNVAETSRKSGVINEELWPFSSNMNEGEYFSAIPQAIKDLAFTWLSDYKIGYEWVCKSGFDKEKAMEALKESPLQTAVDAGSPEKNGIIQPIKPNGYNHAIVIYGYEKNVKWLVYNSYDRCFQEFHWDYPFYTPLKFSLIKLEKNMEINLFRNKENGKIYLVDSDGVRHHIKNESVFKTYFGITAWNNNDWTEVENEAQISHLREGEPITESSLRLVSAILVALKNFGAKLGIK